MKSAGLKPQKRMWWWAHSTQPNGRPSVQVELKSCKPPNTARLNSGGSSNGFGVWGEPPCQRLMRQCPLLHHPATRSLRHLTDDIRGARAKPSPVLLARHAKQVFGAEGTPPAGPSETPPEGRKEANFRRRRKFAVVSGHHRKRWCRYLADTIKMC